MHGKEAVMNEAGIEPFFLERTIDAPRARVWKAMTEKEQIRQWWSPKGFDNLGVEVDLRPGGLMHYALRSPDGIEFWGRFVYREIVPEKRLVFVVSFADKGANIVRHPWEANWPLELLSTTEFEAEGGRTKIVERSMPLNATEAEIRCFDAARDSMTKGWNGTFDHLDELLARG